MKIMVSSLIALSFMLGSSAYGMNNSPVQQPDNTTIIDSTEQLGSFSFANLGQGNSGDQEKDTDFAHGGFGSNQGTSSDQGEDSELGSQPILLMDGVPVYQEEQPENVTLNNRSTDAHKYQDLLKSMEELKQLKNQRWLNRINGIWEPESEKADLKVWCVGVNKDNCVLNKLQNTLYIKKGDTEYHLVKREQGRFALYKGSDPTDIFEEGAWKRSQNTVTLGNDLTVTIAKKTHERPWVKIEISDKKDENAPENSVTIGWYPEKSDLIIYGADYNKPCAFAGHSVHMVNGWNTINKTSKINKFPKNLTVLADSFVNFSNLHVDNSDCHIISPSIVMLGKITKDSPSQHSDSSQPATFGSAASAPMPDVLGPKPEKNIASSKSDEIPNIKQDDLEDSAAKYVLDIKEYISLCNGLDLSDFKGLYNYGSVNVDNVNLEDLDDAYISGSFKANNVNMYHYSRYSVIFPDYIASNIRPQLKASFPHLQDEQKTVVTITNLGGSYGQSILPGYNMRLEDQAKGAYKFKNNTIDLYIQNISSSLGRACYVTFEEKQNKLKGAKNISFSYVEQDEQGTSVSINGVQAFIKKVSDGQYEFRDAITGRLFDTSVSKKLADKIQDDFNVLKGRLERADDQIKLSKLENNEGEIALIDNNLLNKSGIVAYFDIEGKNLSSQQITVLVRNIDGNLYFHDILSENDFAKPVADKFTEAIEAAGITIKRPINYIDPNKEAPATPETKTDKKSKK